MQSIQERDDIDCCNRKLGMIVSVKITNTEYENYRLIGNSVCSNNWVQVTSDGVEGPPGEISLLNFYINSNMELIMDLETNTNLDFNIDDEGYLKVTI